MLCSNIGINESGHLTFAGEDTVRLAAHYKTPLYLMDEDRIRENCRVYKAAMARAFGEGSFPLYASKAASFKRIYAIMQDEGMAIDVVSAGEIATAKRAGFQMERAFFHGNNKPMPTFPTRWQQTSAILSPTMRRSWKSSAARQKAGASGRRCCCV